MMLGPSEMRLCDPEMYQLNRSEEHTSELQSQSNLVCRLLLEKKKDHRGSDGHKFKLIPLHRRCGFDRPQPGVADDAPPAARRSCRPRGSPRPHGSRDLRLTDD